MAAQEEEEENKWKIFSLLHSDTKFETVNWWTLYGTEYAGTI